jgi:NIMA (never in mitosis gene a)-related kinase 8
VIAHLLGDRKKSEIQTLFVEGAVYCWGDNSKGQLGQSEDLTWKHYPTKIESLCRYKIVDCCAGDGFSLFVSNYGTVLSCGENANGCLGHHKNSNLNAKSGLPKAIGDFRDFCLCLFKLVLCIELNFILKFKLSDKLFDCKIVQIACDKAHVLALDSEGNLYSWGRNEFGALGQKKVSFSPLPMRLHQHFQHISKIFCSFDSSIILTSDGNVYVCGRNTSNRFGFGRLIESVDNLRKIICLKNKVIDVSVSLNHSAFVVAGGYVMTIGDNKQGQLGLGHTKEVRTFPSFVKKLSTKYITVNKLS